MGLEPWNTAISEMSCPPLHNWTKDPPKAIHIRFLFKFTDCLKAGPSTIGLELWLILLGDRYKTRIEFHLLADLKAEKPRSTGS